MVTVRFLEAPGFTPTDLVVFHLVSRGPATQSPEERRWRDTSRAMSYTKLRELFAHNIQEGRNTLWMGDTNDPATPKLHPFEVPLVDSGIDKIRWIPARSSNFDLSLVGAPEIIHNPVEPGHPMKIANVVATANSLYTIS